MDAAELAARIRTLSQAAKVVDAMRSVAASRRRQASDACTGFERYAAATRAALGEAIALLAAEEGSAPLEKAAGAASARRIVVLFSEHGFVGALNERLLDAALRVARDAPGPVELAALGTRGLRLCRDRGVVALPGGPLPSTVSGVGPAADRLTRDLFGAIAGGAIAGVDLVFARRAGMLGWGPQALRLFPPERGPGAEAAPGEPPLRTLPAAALVARIIEEHCLAQAAWALGEAFACEHAARLAAMEASARSLRDELDELVSAERTARQEAITSEILEIAAGAEPLREAEG
ncbi:F0F1 ATP synthase subunit gamma [Sorangium sp. So ce1153]|uniref:F0F1 ATP synthase subunit gamma n=1 Tax=Sorangium sp. So ce1153 TaxID=3133333 RepID=UPI003F61392C